MMDNTMTMDNTTGTTDRCGQPFAGHQDKITLYTASFLQRDFLAVTSRMLVTTATWMHNVRCSTSARKTAGTTPFFVPTAQCSTRGTSFAIGGTTLTATRLPDSMNSTPACTLCQKVATKEGRPEIPLVQAVRLVVVIREVSRMAGEALALHLLVGNNKVLDKP